MRDYFTAALAFTLLLAVSCTGTTDKKINTESVVLKRYRPQIIIEDQYASKAAIRPEVTLNQRKRWRPKTLEQAALEFNVLLDRRDLENFYSARGYHEGFERNEEFKNASIARDIGIFLDEVWLHENRKLGRELNCIGDAEGLSYFYFYAWTYYALQQNITLPDEQMKIKTEIEKEIEQCD